MTTFVIKGKVYEIPGFVYDDDLPQFKYFIPKFTGSFWIVDCLVCDENMNTHPDLKVGVPIETENMVRCYNNEKSNNI